MPETAPTPQLRIGLFGQAGAGKTTLLASYYGTLQNPSPNEDRSYSLTAKSPAQGGKLLSRYHQMEEGEFPASTATAEDYVFRFAVNGTKVTALEVHILDYPGGWWTQEESDAELEADRTLALQKLGSAQVGILLVDGAKFKRDGGAYLKTLFDSFGSEISNLRLSGTGAGDDDPMPESWVIALAKADLFGIDYTAEAFSRDVFKHAGEQLTHLAAKIGPETLGHRFLLLSSARQGDRNTVSSATDTLGLTLLAPVAFKTTVDHAAQLAADNSGTGSGAERFIRILKQVLSVVDELDDFLPRKYQIITSLLKAVEANDFLDEKLVLVRSKREKAVKNGNLYKAAALSMAEQLRQDTARPLYHESQLT